MTSPLLRKSILAGVILLLLGGGGGFLYADQILDALVRPWVEQQAGQALDGNVQIGDMTLQANLLAMNAMTVTTPAGLTLSVPRIEVEFSLASLLQRRLEVVRIDSPRIELKIPQTSSDTAPPAPVPSRPALTIDQIVLNNGEVVVYFGEQQALLHGIALRSALGEAVSFELDVFIGAGENNPVAAKGQINWEETLAVSLQEVLWQNRSMLEAPLELELLAKGESRGSGGLKLESLDEKKLTQLLSVVGIKSPLPEDLGFDLNRAVVSIALIKGGLDIGLAVKSGQLRQGETVVSFERMQVDLLGQGKTWQGRGSLFGPAATAVSFEAEYASEQLTGNAVVEVPNPDRLTQELFGAGATGVAGGIQLELSFSWQEELIEINAKLQGQKSSSLPEDTLLTLAPLSGEASWRQTPDQEQFDLNLLVDKKPLLTASGTLEQIKFALPALNRQQLSAMLGPRLLPDAVEAIEGVMATGQLRREQKGAWGGDVQLSARKIGVAGALLKELSLQGRMKLAPDSLTFSHGQLEAGFVKGDELKGQLSSRFSAGLKDQQYFVTLEKLALDNAEYLSPDGLSGLGGGRIHLQGLITRQMDHAELEINLSGNVKAGEILVGAFYADLSALQGNVTVAGELTEDTSAFKAKEMKVDIPGLGAFSGNGLVASNEVAIAGRLQFPDLADNYGDHLEPVLSEIYPSLQGLTLEGALAVVYQLQWTPSGAQIAGEIRPDGLDAYWQKWKLEIVDGTGRLPFLLKFGEPRFDASMAVEQQGEISFLSLSAGLAHLEKGQLHVAAAPNHFSFLSPLVFNLADGRVAINALSLGFGPTGPQGSVRISIQKVDLEKLTRELALPVMQGGITAELGEIRYIDQQLSTEGEALIEVFDGRFRLRNMRFLDPFSSYPAFTADVDFSGLDLNQATHTFEFGEMNGVVDGYIHGLRMFGKTPSAFKARLESRQEGKRNISVKALNNLSILSQGGISAALSKGVYQFIDFYRFQKIGLLCALEKDTFVLKGTALDDSDQYLVYGGLLPPRINIKTNAPAISFKEMVRRLSRIERAGN